MILTLQRTHAHGAATFGKLFADGVFLCYTLEDLVREVPGQSVAAWKVHGATAIPATPPGEPYRITLAHSMRFGLDTITVCDVPGFTYIRMHGGNTANDTEGCPLLGMAINEQGIVGGTSRPAVKLAQTAVQQALARGESVWLEVLNEVATA